MTVAHYPPATSKWNPIEHRLFCEVSKNWAGRPLDSYETILKYLRTTRTSTGLRVRAHLVRKTYMTGVKVTDAQNARAAHHTEQRHAQVELHHRTHVAKPEFIFASTLWSGLERLLTRFRPNATRVRRAIEPSAPSASHLNTGDFYLGLLVHRHD